MKVVLAVLLSGIISLSISCKKEDALKGFDKTALFAAPAVAEINAVENMWAQRNLVPTDLQIEETHTINPKLSLHIISFRLYGSKEYAAVLVPAGTQPLPVSFYVGGYATEQDPVNSVHLKLAPGQAEDLPFIYVVPALRGQYVSLQIDETKAVSPLSEGSRFDAFDGATDDVIAALNAVGALFPRADTSRAMIRGGSRGGIVALLAGERDQRFKRVAPVAFNVDFIGLTSILYNDPIYKEQFLQELIAGTATIEETRSKLIACSPLYFCSRLPKTQLHSAANDRITPAAQGEMLFQAMKDLRLESRVELFIYPGRDHNTIATNNVEMENHIQAFFSEIY